MAEREEFIKGLRELADWYEQHPDAPAPFVTEFNVFPSQSVAGGRSQLEVAQELARKLAPIAKQYDDNFFALRKEFSAGVAVEFNFHRESVCEKKVVGTKVIPAQPEREVEVVEWDCHPLLAPSEEATA